MWPKFFILIPYLAMTSQPICILLGTTTYHSALEQDIKQNYSAEILRIRGVPKSLLPVSGKPGLTWLWDDLQREFSPSNVYLITNAHNYKHYERWASGHDFPRANIVNSGFSSGAISDIELVRRIRNIQNDVLIVTTELLCYNFSELHKKTSNGGNCILYVTEEPENRRTMELIEQKRGAPVAFVLSKESLDTMEAYLDDERLTTTVDVLTRIASSITIHEDVCQFLRNQSKKNNITVEAIQIPSSPLFSWMGQEISLVEYDKRWKIRLDNLLPPSSSNPNQLSTDPIVTCSYARVGLMGNPSDGFFGKTIALLISNFWAQTTLIPNSITEVELGTITLVQNPVADPLRFSNLESLVIISTTDGYDNGERLLQATCKVFYTYCKSNNITINTSQGFRVFFETNIPRQVGLAGSSAIITAFWKSLMRFYGVQINPAMQATLVLQVEQEELGISAGLQDRVIQAYGGLVYSDYDELYIKKYQYGKYEEMDTDILPNLFLAYVANPKDSGKVHSSVRQRWNNKDKDVIDGMRKLMEYTDQAKIALEHRDYPEFARLMQANYRTRRSIYGDAALGAHNIRMIEIAEANNCVAKFPGSGGAVVGMWNGSKDGSPEKDMRKLRLALERENYVYVDLKPMGRQYDI